MTTWSLTQLMASLHDEIEGKLRTARRTLGHSTEKGDASESVWLELLRSYLPQRYSVAKAHVVDSKGSFSQQIDVLIFDRQYSPFMFNWQGSLVVPAESVYAVFEAKQSLNADHIGYSQEKIASVRALHRTSLPIPHAGGTYPAKVPGPILGGLLTFESDWNPPLGNALIEALTNAHLGRLDTGCVAAHGLFGSDGDGKGFALSTPKAATAFLLDLIERLQAMATVSMIDIRAYARWLST